MSNNGSQSNQELEGCVTRRETDYYITPESGGTPIHLKSNQDLTNAENHHARVSGHYENNQNNSTASSGSSMNNNLNSTAANSGSNMSSNNNSNSGNDFLVTEVKSVTESCPANGNPSH
jgi:hypothetical protein